MPVSRREFLRIGGISAFLIAGNSLGLSGIAYGQSQPDVFARELPTEIYNDILTSYHAEDFRKLIGSEFSLFAEDFAGTAILIGVEDYIPSGKFENKKRSESTENFTLSFRISNPEAEQATYTVIQGTLGQFDLLFVPAQNAEGEILLNAVINRF